MVESTVFKNNKTQAVRLPRKVALPDHVKKVTIIKLGRDRLITQPGREWDGWFAGPKVTEDFMVTRDQEKDQERGGF